MEHPEIEFYTPSKILNTIIPNQYIIVFMDRGANAEFGKYSQNHFKLINPKIRQNIFDKLLKSNDAERITSVIFVSYENNQQYIERFDFDSETKQFIPAIAPITEFIFDIESFDNKLANKLRTKIRETLKYFEQITTELVCEIFGLNTDDDAIMEALMGCIIWEGNIPNSMRFEPSLELLQFEEIEPYFDRNGVLTDEGIEQIKDELNEDTYFIENGFLNFIVPPSIKKYTEK